MKSHENVATSASRGETNLLCPSLCPRTLCYFMLPLVLSVAEQGVYQTVTLKVLAALQLNGTW